MINRPILSAAALLAATLVSGPLATSAAAGGTISGTANFDGTPPQRKQIKMSADPKCEEANPDGRFGDVFVISDDKKVQNVFVYIKEGLGDQKFEAPSEPVEIDQHGCMYTPHVIGAMVGQTVEIVNSDSTLHNVHALPEASKQFNSAMPMKGMTIKKKFTAPEIMVRMKCDVHPWMSAFVGVVSNPFFAVTGPDGKFTIANVPPGKYTIEAWHEKMGTKTATVEVTEGGTATADFTFATQE